MKDQTTIVSKVPAITPELLAANEEFQKELRERYVYVPGSHRTYAQTVIRDLIDSIDAITRHIAESGPSEDLETRLESLCRDAAVWLTSIGHFRDAMAFERNRENFDRLQEFVAAEELPDDAWCEHPQFEHIDGQLSQVATREISYVPIGAGVKKHMMRCRICGFRNSTDLPPAQYKLKAYRDNAVKTGQDAGLTLAEIIK